MIDQLFLDKLKILAENEIILKALKAIFDERINKERPIVNQGESDELLGQKFRAYERAKEIIEAGFGDINNLKEIKNPTKNFDESK
jgi:hypothetical protein